MTSLQPKYVSGQAEALKELGLTKEAIFGQLLQGGKALLGKGLMGAVKGGGSILPKTQASIGNLGRKMYLGGTKAGTRLKINAGKADLGGRSAVRKSLGEDVFRPGTLDKGRGIKNFPQGNTTLHRRQAPAHKIEVPGPTPMNTSPKTPPPAVAAPTPRTNPATANMGNAPVANTLPKTGPQAPKFAEGAHTPFTPPPTLPKMPPTDQSKVTEWMKQNPILAGAGGLMGYKALNNNNDNIVIGR